MDELPCLVDATMFYASSGSLPSTAPSTVAGGRRPPSAESFCTKRPPSAESFSAKRYVARVAEHCPGYTFDARFGAGRPISGSSCPMTRTANHSDTAERQLEE